MDRIRLIGTAGKEGKGESQFAQPRGICVNINTKEIFVVDCNNHRIQVFHLYSLAFIRQIGKGTQGSAPGCLQYPVGICLDSDQIFVADTNNHRIVVFNHITGGYVRSIGSQGSGLGCLNCPYGVCLDQTTGYLYVADYENNRVQVFDSESSAFLKIFGEGQGSAPGHFNQPIDLCIDPDFDRLYVADYSNNRVQVLHKETGQYIRSIGQTSGADAMNGPRALCVNKESSLLFVSDRENHRIQMYDKNTYTLIRHIGEHGSGIGQFNRPMEICVDNEEGVLLVVDGYNHRIQIIELPELSKEKQRLRNNRRQKADLDTVPLYPSAVAVSTQLLPDQMVVDNKADNFSLVRFPYAGLQYASLVASPCLSKLQSEVFSSLGANSFDGVDVLESSPELRNDPVLRQAETFLSILESVSDTAISSDTLPLLAPSLLALHSLSSRGWTSKSISTKVASSVMNLLLDLPGFANGAWERTALLQASIMVLKLAISWNPEAKDIIVSKLLQALREPQECYTGATSHRSSDSLASARSDTAMDSGTSLVLAILELLGAVLRVSSSEKLLIFNQNQSYNLEASFHSSGGNDGPSALVSKPVVSLMFGSDWNELHQAPRRRRISTSGSKRSLSLTEQKVIRYPITLNKVLEATMKNNTKATLERSDRDELLRSFASHLNTVTGSENRGLQIGRETKTRGGRQIWNGVDAIAVGDLLDCMDKEKSWFESMVIDLLPDGSVRVHFLGWGVKWDDNVLPTEIPTRIGPLNSHTKNWRSDLHEGGLIEIKCNDDIVNQKWMWGRISKLNIEENWVEVAYSFSNEPIVVKKAWLFGETICPVGMHTKDKSKAAAAMIVRPGKTVREIMQEKSASVANDAAFYDLEDDYIEKDINPSIERGFSVGLIENMSNFDFSSSVIRNRSLSLLESKMGLENTEQVVPWLSSFLFFSVCKEIAVIVAEFASTCLVNDGIVMDEIDASLASSRLVVEAICRTSHRHLVAVHIIRVIYFQAGIAAKSIASGLSSIRIDEEKAFLQTLDLSEQLSKLNRIYGAIAACLLANAVTSASTISYVQEKIRATIDFCGFTPVANEILSTLARDNTLARSFFAPLLGNQKVYYATARYRNFFRLLVASGGKHEVSKLVNQLEVLAVKEDMDRLPIPHRYFGKSVKVTQAIKFMEEVRQRIRISRSLLDNEVLKFPKLLLAAERQLSSKFQRFSSKDTKIVAKLLAKFLNHILSKDSTLSQKRGEIFHKEVVALIDIIANEELLDYFRAYFCTECLFRLTQGNYRSLDEESTAHSSVGFFEILAGFLADVETFPGINNQFHRYLLRRVDTDEITPDPFALEVANGKGLVVSSFRQNSWMRIASDLFLHLTLPPSMRLVMLEFESFARSSSFAERPRRVGWCLGLGRMEIDMIVRGRKTAALVVTEPQFVLLSTLAGHNGKLSLARLALLAGISIEATKAVAMSMLYCSDEFSLLQADDCANIKAWRRKTDSLNSSTVVQLNFTAQNRLFVEKYDCSKRFWEMNSGLWKTNNGWRESQMDSTIIRQLKVAYQQNSMTPTSKHMSKDTINAIDLSRRVVAALYERYPQSIFSEAEVLERCQHLNNAGVIYSTLGIAASNFNKASSSDIRYSYFPTDKPVNSNNHNNNRQIWSRRSQVRPGKLSLPEFLSDEKDDAALSLSQGESKTTSIQRPMQRKGVLQGQDRVLRSLLHLSIEDFVEIDACTTFTAQLEQLSKVFVTAVGHIVSDLNELVASSSAVDGDDKPPIVGLDSFLLCLKEVIQQKDLEESILQILWANLPQTNRVSIMDTFHLFVLIENNQVVSDLCGASFQRCFACLKEIWRMPCAVKKQATNESDRAQLDHRWIAFMNEFVGYNADKVLNASSVAGENKSDEDSDGVDDHQEHENERETTHGADETTETVTLGAFVFAVFHHCGRRHQEELQKATPPPVPASGKSFGRSPPPQLSKSSPYRPASASSFGYVSSPPPSDDQNARSPFGTLLSRSQPGSGGSNSSGMNSFRRADKQQQRRIKNHPKISNEPASASDLYAFAFASDVDAPLSFPLFATENRALFHDRSSPSRSKKEEFGNTSNVADSKHWMDDLPIPRPPSSSAMMMSSRSSSDVGLIESDFSPVKAAGGMTPMAKSTKPVAVEKLLKEEGGSSPLLVDLSDAIPNYEWTARLMLSTARGRVEGEDNNGPFPVRSVLDIVRSVQSFLVDALHNYLGVSGADDGSDNEESMRTEGNADVAVLLTLVDAVLPLARRLAQQKFDDIAPLIWWGPWSEGGLVDLAELAVNLSQRIKTSTKGSISSSKASLSCGQSFHILDPRFDLKAIMEGGQTTDTSSEIESEDLAEEMFDLSIDRPNRHYADIIASAAAVLNMHWSIASSLLAQCDWDIDVLFDRFFEASGKNNTSNLMSFLGIWHTAADAIQGQKQNEVVDVICFSCNNCVSASSLFSLGCGHYSCKDCWSSHLRQHLASIDDASKATNTAVVIPCERLQRDPHCQCAYVCGAEMIGNILGSVACKNYLKNLTKNHQQSYDARHQMLVTSPRSSFLLVTEQDPSAGLTCALCHQQQRLSLNSHGQLVKKVSDLSLSVAAMNHSGHCSKVTDYLTDIEASLSVCVDSDLYVGGIRKLQFWRLYLDCQYLIDHCQSMSLLDLDLLRLLKDMIQKNVDQLNDAGAASTQMLQSLRHARSRLALLYEQPDPSSSRLALSPTSAPASVAAGKQADAMSPIAVMMTVNLSSFRWPQHLPQTKLEQDDDEMMKEIGDNKPNSKAVPSSSTAKENIEILIDELSSYFSFSASVPDANRAFMGRVAQLRDLLYQTKSPILVVRRDGNYNNRRWTVLVDALQYPPHDMPSYCLVLDTLRLFLPHCISTGGELEIREDFVVCLQDIVSAHHDQPKVIESVSQLITTVSKHPIAVLCAHKAMRGLLDLYYQLLHAQEGVTTLFMSVAESTLAVLTILCHAGLLANQQQLSPLSSAKQYNASRLSAIVLVNALLHSERVISALPAETMERLDNTLCGVIALLCEDGETGIEEIYALPVFSQLVAMIRRLATRLPNAVMVRGLRAVTAILQCGRQHEMQLAPYWESLGIAMRELFGATGNVKDVSLLSSALKLVTTGSLIYQDLRRIFRSLDIPSTMEKLRSELQRMHGETTSADKQSIMQLCGYHLDEALQAVVEGKLALHPTRLGEDFFASAGPYYAAEDEGDGDEGGLRQHDADL